MPDPTSLSENAIFAGGGKKSKSSNELPAIETFSVSGQSKLLVNVPKGIPQKIEWKTSRAETCSLKQDDKLINSGLSGVIELSFESDSTMTLRCSNERSNFVEKTINIGPIAEPTIAKFMLANQDISPVFAITDADQTIEWDAPGASACLVRLDNQIIGTETSATKKIRFPLDANEDATVSIKCQNSDGEEVSKSLSITLIDEVKVASFTLDGESPRTAVLSSGTTHLIEWTSIGAESCVVKHGNQEISNTTIAGAANLTFSSGTELSIQCKDAKGKKKSKGIDINLLLAGNLANIINGFFYDSDWGGMVVRLENNNSFLATYGNNGGSVIGTYDPTTGIVKGRWCELDEFGNRATNDNYVGDIEFEFVEDKKGNVQLQGRWREGDDGKWHKNWEMKLEPQPDLEQQQIQQTLSLRLNNPAVFCP